MRRADQNLLRLAEAVGWPEDLRRRLAEGVHARFRPTFRKIITDGRTREKFDPLFKYMEIGAREEASFAAIERHIEYQLWCFNQAPALGNPRDVERGERMTLGCPLKDIYLRPDCGTLSWGEIDAMKTSARKHGPRRTPFDEGEGGRHSMLEQVIKLLGDGQFNDAIVIQGVAGAGKSTFTLRLCVELRHLGLRPIRIRMRHLLLDGRRSLFEDMGQAIAQNSGDQAFDKMTDGQRPATSDFDVGGLFDESVPFGEAEICPYVVIFDGWDEISVSASEGFRKRIDDTLFKIRRQIIDNTRNRVRVVLTGRPSFDVQEVGFLLGQTPVLTIRPLLGDQVEQFAKRLLDYRIETGHGDRTVLQNRINNLLAQVKASAVPLALAERDGILGLPLLALLAIWLTLNDTAEVVGSDRTALYRRLVDMTCKYGGNVQEVGFASRFVGNQLRALLRRTAAAMTMLGTENISYTELEHRLRTAGLENGDDAPQGGDARQPHRQSNDKLFLQYQYPRTRLRIRSQVFPGISLCRGRGGSSEANSRPVSGASFKVSLLEGLRGGRPSAVRGTKPCSAAGRTVDHRRSRAAYDSLGKLGVPPRTAGSRCSR